MAVAADVGRLTLFDSVESQPNPEVRSAESLSLLELEAIAFQHNPVVGYPATLVGNLGPQGNKVHSLASGSSLQVSFDSIKRLPEKRLTRLIFNWVLRKSVCSVI